MRKAKQSGAKDCPNRSEGCMEKPVDVELHLQEECLYRMTTCILCQRNMMQYEQQEHAEEICPLLKCQYCSGAVKRDQMDRHLGICPEKPPTCKFGCGFVGSDEQQRLHCESQTNQAEHIRLVQEKLDNQSLAQRDKAVELEGAIASVRRKIEQSGLELNFLRGQVEMGQNAMTRMVTDMVNLDKRTENLSRRLDRQRADQEAAAAMAHSQTAAIANMINFYQGRAECAMKEVCSHDGKLLMKIQNYEQSKASGQPIISLAFFTKQAGYKMRVHAYLRNASSGLPSTFHLELMEGEFDGRLPWPFPCQVQMFFGDQKEQRRKLVFFDNPGSAADYTRARPSPNSNNPQIVTSYCVAPQELENILVDDTLFLGVAVTECGSQF